MVKKQIAYAVNGAISTAWRRLAGSKTFWVVSAFVLTAADRWNRGEISTADFFHMVQIGVIGILIRAAMSRAELAANAANPDVAAVKAIEQDRRMPLDVARAAACLVGAGALLTLTACAGAGELAAKRLLCGGGMVVV